MLCVLVWQEIVGAAPVFAPALRLTPTADLCALRDGSHLTLHGLGLTRLMGPEAPRAPATRVDFMSPITSVSSCTHAVALVHAYLGLVRKTCSSTTDASVASLRVMALAQHVLLGRAGLPVGGLPVWPDATSELQRQLIHSVSQLFTHYLSAWHTVPCATSHPASVRSLVAACAMVLVDSVARWEVPEPATTHQPHSALSQVLTGRSPFAMGVHFGLPLGKELEELSAGWILPRPAFLYVGFGWNKVIHAVCVCVCVCACEHFRLRQWLVFKTGHEDDMPCCCFCSIRCHAGMPVTACFPTSATVRVAPRNPSWRSGMAIKQ